jgi:DnaJ family protein C protein 3
MKLPTTLVISIIALAQSALADSAGLEHPGLQPLVARANGFLAAGQFNDAIKALTDAIGTQRHAADAFVDTEQMIDLSPVDYLLYYKRATAQLSLARHSQALDDFEQVIKLSKGNFEKAYLMQGSIHLKEGRWKETKEVMGKYKGKDKGAQDVVRAVSLSRLR